MPNATNFNDCYKDLVTLFEDPRYQPPNFTLYLLGDELSKKYGKRIVVLTSDLNTSEYDKDPKKKCSYQRQIERQTEAVLAKVEAILKAKNLILDYSYIYKAKWSDLAKTNLLRPLPLLSWPILAGMRLYKNYSTHILWEIMQGRGHLIYKPKDAPVYKILTRSIYQTYTYTLEDHSWRDIKEPAPGSCEWLANAIELEHSVCPLEPTSEIKPFPSIAAFIEAMPTSENLDELRWQKIFCLKPSTKREIQLPIFQVADFSAKENPKEYTFVPKKIYADFSKETATVAYEII